MRSSEFGQILSSKILSHKELSDYFFKSTKIILCSCIALPITVASGAFWRKHKEKWCWEYWYIMESLGALVILKLIMKEMGRHKWVDLSTFMPQEGKERELALLALVMFTLVTFYQIVPCFISIEIPELIPSFIYRQGYWIREVSWFI